MKCPKCGKVVFGDIIEHTRTGCISKPTTKPKPNPKPTSGQMNLWPK